MGKRTGWRFRGSRSAEEAGGMSTGNVCGGFAERKRREPGSSEGRAGGWRWGRWWRICMRAARRYRCLSGACHRGIGESCSGESSRVTSPENSRNVTPGPPGRTLARRMWPQGSWSHCRLQTPARVPPTSQGLGPRTTQLYLSWKRCYRVWGKLSVSRGQQSRDCTQRSRFKSWPES